MMNVLSSAIAGGGPLAVIASMITPAFLIVSTANLIGSTLSRLARTVDRARTVMADIDAARKDGNTRVEQAGRAALRLYGRRGALVQYALGSYYVAIGFFVATSLAIALTHVLGHPNSWLPAWLTVAGAVLLFTGTLLLAFETRMATHMLHAEIAGALDRA
jgi:Protein of unknown function (DUF2721)